MRKQGQSKSVLVVDDEQGVRDAFSMLLTYGGYEVESACSGEDALPRLAAKTFHLVLTDNAMPGMSGVDLAEAIKARWPSLPIVMLSAYPPCHPQGSIDLILKKPDGVSVLLESIREILDRKPLHPNAYSPPPASSVSDPSEAAPLT